MNEETLLITQDEMSALLGRPLSSSELDNYQLYLQIAILRIEDLLCIKLGDYREIPADLKLLLARCFSTISLENTAVSNHGINKKQVEDFSISYIEAPDSPMVEFVKLNAPTIQKYGECQAPIRSGKVCCGNSIRCI